jgi:ribonuclease VapC
MLVIDTSAIIAVFFDEPEAPGFMAVIEKADDLFVSTASILEAQMVLSGRYPGGGADALDKFVAQNGLKIMPFGETELALARTAFPRFGKGRDKAGLNFGDCMAYALAKSLGVPLLFKGDDFAQTDVVSAVQ